MRQGGGGHEFDIWVVLGRIGHDMVDVAAAFPPAQTESPEEVSDENANAGINLEVVCNSHVAGIMGCEHELVPEAAEKQAGKSKVCVA